MGFTVVDTPAMQDRFDPGLEDPTGEKTALQYSQQFRDEGLLDYMGSLKTWSD